MPPLTRRALALIAARRAQPEPLATRGLGRALVGPVLAFAAAIAFLAALVTFGAWAP